MPDHEQTLSKDPLAPWDADLLNRRFVIDQDRPPISAGARRLDIKENLKRHKTFSTDNSLRGRWKQGNQPKPSQH